MVYVVKHGEDESPVGDFLGDLTDELDGKHIVEYVSADPKNYAYLLNNGDTQCKVKGFTLNHENAKKSTSEPCVPRYFFGIFMVL